MNPFQVVKDFEAALCEYTGAPYAVTTTSCTMALLLACAHLRHKHGSYRVQVPCRTYCSVPMSILHAGHSIRFVDEPWSGAYRLKPLSVVDSARRFTSDMYRSGEFQCVSFHWNKILGIQQGGAILHDDPRADEWLRRARFDGRKEGVAPKDDDFTMLGYHCYMAPDTAAEGLVRLSFLPRDNPDMPNDDYPDLSKFKVFM